MGGAVTRAAAAAAQPAPESGSASHGPAAVTLAVENMHCGGCITSVERALRDIPGVLGARANLSARRVTVDCAAGVVTDDLVAGLERAGYRAAELFDDNADAAQAARDADLTRRLGVAGFAAMNIMLLSVAVWSGQSGDMEPSLQSLFHWLSALIALPAVAYAGQPFFRSAAGAIRAGRLNMDVPISLGVILATGMSLFQTVRGTHHVYFDAAVMLLAFLLVGRLLDQQMRTRASGAAANLLGLRVTSATVLGEDGSLSRLSVRHLEPGMRIIAAAGERLAADGLVRAGTSEVDESLITGETVPRAVKPGAPVYAGTVNLAQPLTLEVTARDDHSLLADIARLMAAAEQSKGLYVRLADRAARLYAPAVHVLGLATFVGWMLAGHGWEPALTAAIAVLIITCPCALALAVPAVQVAATSRLFGRGVIVKAADGLERMTEVDTIVLDKTGTLTTGEPQVLNDEAMPDAVLLGAASLAVHSRHPYARAVVAAARARGLAPAPGCGVTEVAGAGLARASDGCEERLGSAAWAGGGRAGGQGAEVWYKPARGEAVVFRMADPLRPDAVAVVAQLKAAGYAIELLSGDRAGVVGGVARQCGIETWAAGQRPHEKIERLAALKAEGRKVLMVGDGLNDAPALAAAHASLSPSSAADISQTAADGIVQGARLGPILDVLAVAKAARRMAVENFALAIAYNIVFVPLAVAGYVTPLIAAVAMSVSSVSVTANAVRLRTMRLELRK